MWLTRLDLLVVEIDFVWLCSYQISATRTIFVAVQGTLPTGQFASNLYKPVPSSGSDRVAWYGLGYR